MSVVAQSLQPGTTLTATAASVLTASAGTTVISQGVLSNPTSIAVAFTIQIQRSGGSVLDIVSSRTVQPNGTDLLQELGNLTLNSGDVLLASGAGLVCIISGYGMS